MNYDFVQKNHWRNRIWNEFARRVKVHPRDAICIYLAGESDLDRGVAMRKGFRDYNLIAVDRDIKTVEKLRAGGALAICGDLFDVARAWPHSLPVSVFHADLTCGLFQSVWGGFCDAASRVPFENVVFCANLMRGRDAESNRYRHIAQSNFVLNPHLKKHRAIHCVAATTVTLAELTTERRNADIEYFQRLSARSCEFIRQSRFSYGTYTSECGVKFDWCVWNTSMIEFVPGDPITPRSPELDPLARQISAVLAHRTRRMNAAA